MDHATSTNVIAFPGLQLDAAVVRKLRLREQATVPPPAVPYCRLVSSDPSQKIARVADNAFHIEGMTTNSAVLHTMVELTVEMRTFHVALGKGESPHGTAQRIIAAIPHGFRGDVCPSLPLGSMVVKIERDDESKRETAAA